MSSDSDISSIVDINDVMRPENLIPVNSPETQKAKRPQNQNQSQNKIDGKMDTLILTPQPAISIQEPKTSIFTKDSEKSTLFSSPAEDEKNGSLFSKTADEKSTLFTSPANAAGSIFSSTPPKTDGSLFASSSSSIFAGKDEGKNIFAGNEGNSIFGAKSKGGELKDIETNFTTGLLASMTEAANNKNDEDEEDEDEEESDDEEESGEEEEGSEEETDEELEKVGKPPEWFMHMGRELMQHKEWDHALEYLEDVQKPDIRLLLDICTCYNALLCCQQIDDDEDLVDMGKYASMVLEHPDGLVPTPLQKIRALYYRGRSLMHMDPPPEKEVKKEQAAQALKNKGKAKKNVPPPENPADVYLNLALKDFNLCLELDKNKKISDLTKIEISKVKKELASVQRKRKKKFFASEQERQKIERRKASGKKAFNTHAMKH